MKKILGLDLGIASVGWALVNEADQPNEKSSIIDMGVRIQSQLTKDIRDNFTKGAGYTVNADRASGKAAMRNHQRYLQRRAKLIRLMTEAGLISPESKLYEDGAGTTHETLRLRSTAVTDRIELEELARVLISINKKRGYKSNRLAEKSSSEGKEGKADKDTDYVKAIKENSRSLEMNDLTVGQWSYQRLCENRHNSLVGEIFYRADYENEFDAIWREQMKHHRILTEELGKGLKDAIFFQRNLKSKKSLLSTCKLESRECEIEDKAKGRMVRKTIGPKVCPKSMPLFQEFRIWQTINNLEAKNYDTGEVVTLRDPKHDELRQQLFSMLNIKKSVKPSEVLKLFFRTSKGCDINIASKTLQGNTTRGNLYDALERILDRAGCTVKISKGQSAEKLFREALAKIGFNMAILDTDLSSLSWEECMKNEYYQLWHVLYSYETDNSPSGMEGLIVKVAKLTNLPLEYAEEIANIRLESDYGNLSTKAIRKILPHLRQGKIYSDAVVAAGYKSHSAESLTNEERDARGYVDRLEILPRNSLRNPVVEKIVNQMIGVVNGICDKYGKPDEIRIELARELKKSADERKDMTKRIAKAEKDHKEIEETLKRELSLTHVSKNDILRYKLWRELAPSYKTLYSDHCIPLEKLLSREFDIEHIIPRALRFDDSFANKTLERASVNAEKSNTTALDYIRSKGGDAEIKYRQKIEKLLKEEKISKAKAKNLLTASDELEDGFLNRDLRETQYIARKAHEILSKLVPSVVSTTGAITDRLREDWGLVDTLKELTLPQYESKGLVERYTNRDGKEIVRIKDWSKRIDHRHHAMDALTIAFTRRAYIQYLNTLSAKDESPYYDARTRYMTRNDRNRLVFIPPMEHMRSEAKKYLERILVSAKSRSRVATKSINKHKNGKVQHTLVPRGPLHNETIYGKRTIYEGGKRTEVYVLRKKLDNTFDPNKSEILDPKIKKILQERYNALGKDAFTTPVWLDEAKGIAIKHVTVIVDKKADSSEPIHDKRDRSGKKVLTADGSTIPTDYIKTGNNHHIVVYEDKDGNCFETPVSFREASARLLVGLPVVERHPAEHPDWKVIYVLKRGDYYIFPSKDFDPSECTEEWIKDPKNFSVISPNLFKVQKLSSKDYWFRHHLDPTTDEEKALQNISWRRVTSLKALTSLIKVRLDHLGHIVEVEKPR